VQAVVGQVGDRDVAAHEPVAVRQPTDLARRRIGLVGDLATTSSMMSSTVTTPATRPYSSTTTAIEVR